MSELVTKPSGIVQPFMFDNMPIRGLVLRLNNLNDHIPTVGEDQGFVNKSLAELLAASAVLNYDLKNHSNVTLQIQSPTPVPLMVAQCDKTGNLRAYARIEENANLQELDYKTLIKEGALFAVTVEQGQGHAKNVYQSLIQLNKTSVSSSVEQYFNDSVQLNTYFKVIVSEEDGNLSCACIFLQALPEEEANMDDWRRMAIILSTLTDEEALSGKITENELLRRLFAEDTVRVFESHDLNFATPKTRERMTKALKSLGEDQCRDLLKEGPIVMTCEFTGKDESFTEEDISNIFDTGSNKD